MILLFVSVLFLPLLISTGNLSSESDKSPSIVQPASKLSEVEEFSYVSQVSSWLYGYIDGKYSGQSGFSLTNLQSDDGSYASLSEATVILSKRFEYTFIIPCDSWSTYQNYEIQIEGYCDYSPEPLEFYWGLSDTTTDTLLGTLEIDETSSVQKSWPIDVQGHDSIYLRVKDSWESAGDGSHSVWLFDYIRLRFSDTYTFVNQFIEVSALYDNDNLYAGKGQLGSDFYKFRCGAYDSDGGSTITRIELQCLKESNGNKLWSVIMDDLEFSANDESPDNSWIEIVPSECQVNTQPSSRSVWFAVRITYFHPEENNVDWRVIATSSTDSDIFTSDIIWKDELDWDVDIHTQLAWESFTSYTQERCDPGSSIVVEGIVKYASSTSGVRAGGIYARVDRTLPISPVWNDYELLDNGELQFTCPTAGSIGTLNRFQVEIATDSFGGSVLLTTEKLETTVDSVIATDYGVTADWVDIEDTVTIYTQLQYYSDNAEITTGTLSWEGVSMTYNLGNARWEADVSTDTDLLGNPLPSTKIFDSISVNTPEGVTLVTTDPEVTVIWDNVLISSIEVIDSHVNVGNPTYLQVQLQYEEAGSWFTTGTINLSGYELTYSGSSGIWQSSDVILNDVGSLTFDHLEIEYNPIGITSVNQNMQPCTIIWDGLIINFTDTPIQRINIGENASGISYSVTYAYSGELYDGTALLNDTCFAYSESGKHGYSVEVLGDDTYEITFVMTDDSTWCIWDSIIITITDPYTHTLKLGENASGIRVIAYYEYDLCRFDGTCILNYSTFVHHIKCRHGYTVDMVFGGILGIDTISENDATYAEWVKEDTILNLIPIVDTVLVSTEYDPQAFVIDMWLSDSQGRAISGTVNISIEDEQYTLYCGESANTTLTYSPLVAGDYSILVSYDGINNYEPCSGYVSGLVANAREITYNTELPAYLVAASESSLHLYNVYDSDFQGIYQSVTYIHDYPIDLTYDLWWTLDAEYGEPRNHLGTWNITQGEHISTWNLQWDLDGDGRLTQDDFECYMILEIHGDDVYENLIVKFPMDIVHVLATEIQLFPMTYSDLTTCNLQMNSLNDESFYEGLELDVHFYSSEDNITWIYIDTVRTDTYGWGSIQWTCNIVGDIYLKTETALSDYYARTECYFYTTSEKETTQIIMDSARNFTYSDQGILTAHLLTDDGEPVSGYSIYLELWDGGWISIGSGISNESGCVSILWIPSLPTGTYDVRMLAPMTESYYYQNPDYVRGDLIIDREILILDVDTTTMDQGYVLACITDDEGTPIEDIPVEYYRTKDGKLIGTEVSNSEGYVQLFVAPDDGPIQIIVSENEYYYGSMSNVDVVLPPDYLPLTLLLGGVFFSTLFVAVGRKYFRGNTTTTAKPVSPEISKALEEEREKIPERRRKQKERNISNLDGSSESDD